MLIDALVRLLPPPISPVETGTPGGWLSVNTLIGVRPPEDYVSFISTYGTGSISDYFWVLNPFAVNPNLNFLRRAPLVLGHLRELKSASAAAVPFPLYFEPGGFLPWGLSDDGDVFGWLTSGLTGHWTTTVFPRHSAPEHYTLPLSRFLTEFLAGRTGSLTLPEDLGVPSFRPITA